MGVGRFEADQGWARLVHPRQSSENPPQLLLYLKSRRWTSAEPDDSLAFAGALASRAANPLLSAFDPLFRVSRLFGTGR
jgi:hypothetical protein